MRGKQIWFSALAALSTTLGACGDGGVYIMTERYEIVDDERVYGGGGCALAFARDGSLSGGGGTSDGDFSYSQTRVGAEYVIVISSQGQELARREYSQEELLTTIANAMGAKGADGGR
ncbi:MAG TPA: hypothetical protein VFZ61_13800, partial [Polyangiales bacterium]